MVTHQLPVRHRPGKIHRSETDLLPLIYTTNIVKWQLSFLPQTCRILNTVSVFCLLLLKCYISFHIRKPRKICIHSPIAVYVKPSKNCVCYLIICLQSVKPGFHYPSWQVTGFHYPSTRPSTRVVETGLYRYVDIFMILLQLLADTDT